MSLLPALEDELEVRSLALWALNSDAYAARLVDVRSKDLGSMPARKENNEGEAPALSLAQDDHLCRSE